jgi:hypothetical protein
MDRPAPRTEELRRLHATLDRLLRRMTRRLPGSPREMQMDAGAAIAMLYDLEVPNRAGLSATLAGLLRELGQRRPDVLRHVVVLESSVAQIGDLLAGSREDTGGEGAP